MIAWWQHLGWAGALIALACLFLSLLAGFLALEAHRERPRYNRRLRAPDAATRRNGTECVP